MDASHIDTEFDNLTKKQVDQAISATAQYISAWTQREYALIVKNKRTPLIWPLPKGGYIIGSMRIIPGRGYWQLLNNNQELRYEFDGKQAAIFYCLCEQIKSYSLATAILSGDTDVKRLKNDTVHYENSLACAIKQQDSIEISIWSARFEDAKLRLSLAQANLKKSIESARSLPIWTK